MKKLYTMIAAATMTIAAAAPASGQSLAFSEPVKPAGITADAPRLEKFDIPVVRRAAAKTSAEEWSAWERIGTTSFDQSLIDLWTRQCGWLGTSMPEFAQPFAVEERRSLTDDTKAELCLRDIFGGVDIVLPYDTRTGYLASEPQSTGIPLNTPGYYENLMFIVTGYYYPSAKKIDLRSMSMLTDGYWGYRSNPSVLVLDGAPAVSFSLETNHFIPSTATELAVKVNRSSNVAWYRVVSAETSMSFEDFSFYLAKEPLHAPNAYADYTGDSFKLTPLGMSAIHSSYSVIPFGADDRVIGSYELADVFYNYDYHHGYNASWNSLGRGRMVEDAVYYGYTNDAYLDIIVDGVPVETPFTSTPELEMTADGSLLCVKNPFGPEHPAYSKLIENFPEAKSDDFYMVFDISDPSRVRLCETLSGLKNNGYAQMSFYSEAGLLLERGVSRDEIDSREDCLWGKFADNRVTIPRKSSLLGTAYDNDFEITVELPGYVDYDIKAEPSMTSDGTAYGWLLNYVSPNIVSVDYALVPESYYKENRNFPERVIAGFADSSNGFTVRNVATNGASTLALSIPEAEIGYGNWVLAAAGRDASGNAHSALFVPQVLGKARPLSEWRNAGFAKVNDGIICHIFTSHSPVSFTVELLENPDVDGVYLLPDYYRKVAEAYGHGSSCDPAAADPFVLDLRGEYPMLTNSLSGARFTGEMMTGMDFNVSENTVFQPRVMNGCDYYNYAGNYGSITRGPEGAVERVDLSNGALICVLYNSATGEILSNWDADDTWVDFTYDFSTDYEHPENWKHAGTAAITENIVGQLFGAGENTAECDVYTCSFEEGLYRLDAPLAGMPFAAHGGEFVHGWDQTLYIHAADPGKVYLTSRPEEILSEANWTLNTGWSGANGSDYLCMIANALSTGALNNGWNAEDYLGTFDREKGEFVLDNCFYHYFQSTRRVEKPENPRFRVVLGGSSGIDEAATAGAEVVSVEYYSVDGRRLAAPADGLSICRTSYSDGRVVTDKVVF